MCLCKFIDSCLVAGFNTNSCRCMTNTITNPNTNPNYLVKAATKQNIFINRKESLHNKHLCILLGLFCCPCFNEILNCN